LIVALALAPAVLGCGDDDACHYDVDCPVGRRCVASQCRPIELPDRDASAGRDAGVDADAPALDGGLDAGDGGEPDASIPACTVMTIEPADGVLVATAADDEPVAFARGDGGYAVLYRALFTSAVTALRVDEAGQAVGLPAGPLSTELASPKLALAGSDDGSFLAVWVEGQRVHAALVTEDGFVALGPLSEVASGTFHPSAARTGDGWVVAWGDDSVGRNQISSVALDPEGVVLAPPVRIDTPADARLPSVASGAEADVALVWQDARSGEFRLRGGFRAADGTIPLDIELAAVPVVQTAALVRDGPVIHGAWTQPADVDGLGALHLTRAEGVDIEDRVLVDVMNLDPRTSITSDGVRLFVGWHSGSGVDASATVLAVASDLETESSVLLPAESQGARVAADAAHSAVVWIKTSTSAIRFATLVCE
jgi:hypothetical protein